MISLENHSYLLGLSQSFNLNFEVSKNLEAGRKALNKEGKWLPQITKFVSMVILVGQVKT